MQGEADHDPLEIGDLAHQLVRLGVLVGRFCRSCVAGLTNTFVIASVLATRDNIS